MGRQRQHVECGMLGFTLAEALIVVVILAILAAVAIPNYRRSVERGYWRQAQDLLMAIYSGERVYFFRENAYKGGLGPASTMEDWRTIDIDNPNLGATPQVEFSVTASGTGPTATFTATATRKGGGPCDTKTLTIDQARTFIPDANTTVCWTGCGCE